MSACIPTLQTYYYPQGTGKVIGGGECSMYKARELQQRLPEGVVATILMERGSHAAFRASGVIVMMGIASPKDVPVQLIDNAFTIGVNGRAPTQVRFQTISVYADTAPWDTQLKKGTHFVAEVQIPMSEVDSALVQFPSLRISDHHVTLAPVQFTKKRSPYLMPLCQ